jgi:hypothetical protein
MLAPLRAALHRAITSPRGDSFAALRVPKDLARRLNATLGRPLAPSEELANRARARARLAELRAQGGAARSQRADPNENGGGTGARAAVEPAPVLVYCERDRNARQLARIEELLASKGYSWKRLDVAGDPATIEFVKQRAACETDDLPIVFVADHVVGGYEALVRADLSGDLERLVRPS